MNNLDKAQEQHDLDNQLKYYPDDDNICLRCEEEVTEDGKDYCQYCQDFVLAGFNQRAE